MERGRDGEVDRQNEGGSGVRPGSTRQEAKRRERERGRQQGSVRRMET